MRVAVLTQYFPNFQQPWAGHTAYQTLRILAEHCDVHVFFPETTYPRFLKPPGARAPLDRQWQPAGVATTYIPYPALPVVSRQLNGLSIANGVLPHVRSFAPDIVLSYAIYPDGYAAVRVAHRLKVPAVITAIGSDLNRIPDAICRRLTQSALKNADYVSTVSHDLCKTARAMGADPNRSSANLNGCDTDIFLPRDGKAARSALGIEIEGDVIVYVGRLDVRKGLVELIDAMGTLLPERPSLRCYIVGDGPDRPLLVEAIARNNAAENVLLVPSCPTDQVALWMGAATLVTLPSYKEGCPNVVVEGLAAGRPMVATNVGGIPELMDDTCGRLIPAKDVPALAQALEEVLDISWDAEAIASMHNRSWRNVSDDLYAVLEATIARGRV